VRRSDADGVVRLGVIVRLRSGAGLDELRAAGAEIGSVAGDIATARVPVDSLALLADARALAHVEAARVLVLNHDSSMHAIRADRVRQVVGGEWTGATGQGAIVAIYDTGLDFRHPDFIAADGSTRVLELWDQTGAASPPTGFNYGFYCDRPAVQAAIGGNTAACPQQDRVGHGTHVAGSAAGDGSASPQPFQYAGVAPEADLLVVKGGDAGFFEDLLLDGVRWLEQRGAALGRPVVVNLSLGDQYGPHDGTRLLEREIDRLSRAGFMVVNSAGNSGENYNTEPPEPFHILIHARALAILGQTAQFTFVVDYETPHPDSCNGNIAHFSLWHHPADRVRLTVTRPNGTSATAEPGQLVTVNSPVGQILIDNGSQGPDPENGEIHVLFRISGCGQSGPPAPGTWRIGVETVSGGTGSPFDIWLWQQRMGSPGFVRGAQNFDNRFNISSPGNARRVITVGAFVTRTCWQLAGSAQQVCYIHREAIGDIARFSSAGPTRDGRMKPEITAPGIAIVSALSRDAIIDPNRVVAPQHWVLEGTSMAAPHVAGAIALLLAERPDLTPEDVLDVFAFSARQDAFTQRTYGTFADGRPQDWWGFGKLDVEAALGGVADDRPIARLVVTPSRDTLPVGATLQMRVQAFDAENQPFFARAAWQSTNPAVAAVDDRGLVTALAPGTTLIIASAQEHGDTAVIVVEPPATVAITTASASPAAPVLAPRGTRVPLLAITLAASGPEAVDLLQLGFDVTGADPDARIVVHHDVSGDGAISPGDPEIGGVEVALTNAPQRVIVPIAFRIPRNGVVNLVAGVRVSGAAPNLAQFRATLVPGETRTVGVRSGALDRFAFTTPPVASAPAVTTLLPAGQVFALSENPVRGSQLILNFSERPRTVAIYTIAGARVADLTTRLDGDTRIRWDLTNDRAQRIAPGVYLLVVETGTTTIRERLFILTPALAGQE
jgi:subtilisin family serine protease